MPSTMRDVARRAGVSIKTVSRVVNNQAEISEETRQRVLSVINELEYRPNAVARSLVSGRSLAVGVIIPQITDPFFPEFILGVENAANKRGYSVFLCNTHEDPNEELERVDLLAARQVDGFILYGTRLSSTQLRTVSTQYPVSIVSSRQLSGTSVIRVRSRDGLTRITEHLIGLGHQAIGHIGWRTAEDTERVDGYCDALSAHGIAIDQRRIVLTAHRGIESGRLATRQLLAQAPEVTAITCYNDVKAIGALQACEELGLHVPGDIAVAGFDDIPLASLIKPRLTTMKIPCYELGEMAMQQLFRVIGAGGHYEERLEVDSQLVIRESCGAK